MRKRTLRRPTRLHGNPPTKGTRAQRATVRAWSISGSALIAGATVHIWPINKVVVMEAEDRLKHLIGFDPEAIIEKVKETYRDFARQRAYVEQLEHGRKIVIAELREAERTVARKAGGKVSEARLDDLARSSTDYRDYIKDILKAKQKLAGLEAEHYSWRHRWEIAIERVRFTRSELYLQK